MGLRSLELAAEPGADLSAAPYKAYAYAYPHKSSYGPLEPAVPLAPVWQQSDREPYALYVHIPFCEMRCGFCNLFAHAGSPADFVAAYLAALQRQLRVLCRMSAGSAVRLALGGGTPTLLGPAQLEQLFGSLIALFGIDPAVVPASVETSPATATADRLAVLRNHGVRRVSLGVQSFQEEEAHAMGRSQSNRDVAAALDRLRDFPVLNIDLIYGHPLQTVATWLASLRKALEYRPEEVHLYPLYVRPGTGLGRHGRVHGATAQTALSLYRDGRDFLLGAGYQQISMRYFRLPQPAGSTGPVYCCQSDSMLGLGCGARSYTPALHYADRFATKAEGGQAILLNG